MEEEGQHQTLAERLKAIGKSFLLTTSLKGIGRITKSKHWGFRVMWILATLVFWGIGSYFIFESIRIYASFPYSTLLGENNFAGDFPAVTVCNLNPYSERAADYLSQFYDTVKDGYENGRVEKFLKVVTAPKNFFQNIDQSEREIIGHRQDELIAACIPYFSYIPTQIYDNKYTCSEYNLTIRKHTDPDYFNCFTIEPVKKFEEHFQADSLSLVLYTGNFPLNVSVPPFVSLTPKSAKVGVRVALHHVNEVPYLKTGYDVAPGHVTTFSCTSTLYTRLPHPYGECMPLLRDGEQEIIYKNWYQCLLECIQNLTKLDCGCRDPGITIDDESGYPFCSTILENKEEMFKKMTCASEFFMERTYDCSDTSGCGLPCEEIIFDSQVSSSKWPDLQYHLAFYEQFIVGRDYAQKFKIYESIKDIMEYDTNKAYQMLAENSHLIENNFLQIQVTKRDDKMHTVTQNSTYSFIQLIGSLGGGLNLWIGFTVYVLIEIVETIMIFIQAIICGPKSRATRSIKVAEKNQNNRVSSSETALKNMVQEQK